MVLIGVNRSDYQPEMRLWQRVRSKWDSAGSVRDVEDMNGQCSKVKRFGSCNLRQLIAREYGNNLQVLETPRTGLLPRPPASTHKSLCDGSCSPPSLDDLLAGPGNCDV